MSASIFDLPPEILEIILKDLNLKEIGNCALTCERFKQKIANLYKDKSKFLITSGVDEKDIPYPFEVIDLAIPNIKCKLALDVKDIPKHTGCVTGRIQNNIVIGGGSINSNGVGCGEEFFKECYIIGQEGPRMDLLEMRESGRSIVLGDKIWIVGGEKPPLHLDLQDFTYLQKLIEHGRSTDTFLNSTEYIRLNQGTKNGPKLPFRVTGHAMTKVNETTVYIIGGWEIEQKTDSSTWIVDFSKGFKVTRGPELIAGRRSGHSSAIMKIDGKTIIVVVGGNHVGSDDVELLDLSEAKPCWKNGM